MQRDLIPWGEKRQLSRFRREMDRLFERFFEGDWPWPFRAGMEEGTWVPSLDVSETGKEVVVKAELPGMDPKEIDISVRGDMLTIRGERKKEEEKKGENYHRIERSHGTFSRSVRLPTEVDPDKVNATYKDGVLKIEMAKTKAAAAKKIDIKTG